MTKKLQELEARWYQKLKQGGLKDIEDVSWSGENNTLLKEWSFNLFRSEFNEIDYQTTVTYYQKSD